MTWWPPTGTVSELLLWDLFPPPVTVTVISEDAVKPQLSPSMGRKKGVFGSRGLKAVKTTSLGTKKKQKSAKAFLFKDVFALVGSVILRSAESPHNQQGDQVPYLKSKELLFLHKVTNPDSPCAQLIGVIREP